MITWVVKPCEEKYTAWRCEADHCEPKATLSLDALKAQVKDAPVVCLIPTDNVSFMPVTLPQAKPAVIRQALKSLVEEQVAGDIETLHIALPAQYQAGDETTVTVIDCNQMHAHLQPLLSAQMNLQAAVPDVFALPYESGNWTQYLNDNQLWVRTGLLSGFTCNADDQDTWLSYAQRSSASIKTIDEPFSDLLTQALQRGWPVNLMQAVFAPKRSKQPKGIWAKIVYFAAAVVVFHFIYLGVSSVILNHRLEALKGQSLALYAKVYPGATKVTSPKTLIERELSQAGAGSDATFLVLLSYLSEALSQTQGVTLENLQYTHNTLTVQVIAIDFTVLDTLNAVLATMPLQVTQSQTRSADTGVTSQFILRGGRS